jgi:hypothetical protein
MKSLFAAALLSLFILQPASAAETAQSLSATEVRALLSGKTLVGETQLPRFAELKDKTFYVYIKADGRLKILNFHGKTDTGRWEVTPEGHYCSQYDNTRVGKKACYRVDRTEKGYALFDTRRQSISTLFVTQEGNFKGL